MMGKTEGKRMGRQRMRWLDSLTDSMDTNLSKLPEILNIGDTGVLQSMGLQIVGCDLVTEEQQRSKEVKPEKTKYKADTVSWLFDLSLIGEFRSPVYDT